jgi:hypothetical protein
MTAPRVFISMGTPYTSVYKDFRDELSRFLRESCDVDPRIIGVNEYPSGSPVEHIRSTMRNCAGVIIVAYERKYLEKGLEKRGAESSQTLEKRTYTTPWNHIESAIAYSLGLPLYIICQNGLTEEGLIESKVDWYVKHVDIHPGALSDRDLSESLRAWVKTRVIPRSKKSNVLPALSGRVKFAEMTPVEFWAFCVMLLGVFLLGSAIGPVQWLANWFHTIHGVDVLHH